MKRALLFALPQIKIVIIRLKSFKSCQLIYFVSVFGFFVCLPLLLLSVYTEVMDV